MTFGGLGLYMEYKRDREPGETFGTYVRKSSATKNDPRQVWWNVGRIQSFLSCLLIFANKIVVKLECKVNLNCVGINQGDLDTLYPSLA